MKSSQRILATLTLTALLVTTTSMPLDYKYRYKYGVTYPRYYPEESFEELDVSFEESFSKIFQNTNFVPQGLTYDDQYIYVSLYDYKKEFNSVIVTFDFQGHFINICSLKNNAHVGGISYDRNNDLIWVTSKQGMIDAYKRDNIVSKASDFPYYEDLYVGRGLDNYINPFSTSVSFLTIKDDEMFVGNFSLLDNGLVKRYKIDVEADKTVVLTMDGSFEIPKKVQGLSFFNKDEEDYLLLSRSFGANDKSIIQIFKYDPSITDYTQQDSKSIEFPEMLEETFVKDDCLYSLFETSANPYSKTNKKNKTLRMSRIDSLY